eukprot:CAMPEP_0171466218 /NCGR_PEP_ID=MMETSP0945-20130129/9073_1 /TAXON_ID=109269 /ORGANISM="Vaucheria litorea, Strain CCMP2940" /LENGTH=496 /DNA_ID=CAMNT_0011994159 /DNA_START=29 /DNA_END=1519 /DNA_ORIENTATION=+
MRVSGVLAATCFLIGFAQTRAESESEARSFLRSQQQNAENAKLNADEGRDLQKYSTDIQVDLEPRGIAMAILAKTSETTGASNMHLNFEFTPNQLKSVAMMLPGAGSESVGQPTWSFNSYANTAAKISCSKSQCSVAIEGHAHSPFVDEKMPPKEANEENEKTRRRLINTDPILKPTDAVYISELIPARLELRFTNVFAFPELATLVKSNDAKAMASLEGQMRGVFKLNPTSAQVEAGIAPTSQDVDLNFVSQWRLVPVKLPEDFQIAPLPFFERKKNLCIQPVRTRYRKCFVKAFGVCIVPSFQYTYSGAGLDFGRPAADEHWGKVDVTFTWRDWKTIDDVHGTYQSVTEAEMSSLRAKVNDDDCVEVFFVKKFSPSDLKGGGACWSSGTANAKIITSDEQVSCGVDVTHLAHELGHALGLMHPDSDGNRGNTGTLMCPSGWQRDNPRRNSKENGDNIVNPLLVPYWDAMTFDNHDCTDNGDCGSCNAHIPPDSC